MDDLLILENEGLIECEEYNNDKFELVAHEDPYTPKEGIFFYTQEEAFKFYNCYALKMGFGVRWSSTKLSKHDKTKVIGRKFVCSKEGKRKGDLKKNIDIDHCLAREIRVGCKAMMWIRLDDFDRWVITKIILEHNDHELSSPTKSIKHRSHKKVHRQDVIKDLITNLHNQGISNAAIVKVVNTFEPDSIHTITSQQVHDHLRIERKNNMGKNCAIIVNHFKKKKDENKDFYFSIEVAPDLTLRSVFWADKRSQDSYQIFSDVIIFYVTYRTNNFSLPFAPFTGNNIFYLLFF